MFVRATMVAFPGITHEWQQIVVFVVDRLDGARRLRRDRPAQHQAADGLFLDRPHGLRAGRACRRHAGGRAGRAGLHGDLCGDDARHLRLHPAPCAATASWSRTSAISPGSRARNPAMAFFLAMLLFSLAGIPPLAGFFAKFYVFLAAIKAGLYHARGDRRARQRGGRLLLSAHRQDHVFRRAGAELRADAGELLRVVLGVTGLFNHPVLRLSGAAALARRDVRAAKSLF